MEWKQNDELEFGQKLYTVEPWPNVDEVFGTQVVEGLFTSAIGNEGEPFVCMILQGQSSSVTFPTCTMFTTKSDAIVAWKKEVRACIKVLEQRIEAIDQKKS